MYQEVCCSKTSSGIIKNIKIDQINKWRKVVWLKLDTSLDTSIYQELIRSLTQARSI